MLKKFIALFLICLAVSVLSKYIGLTTKQSIVIFIFSLSIVGTLFFWDFRISFLFLGSGILLLLHAIELEKFISYASLDVILFLIGMMILVAMMKESGFFLYLTTLILRIKGLDGKNLFLILMLLSAFLSALMGEVTSTILMTTIIFTISSFLEVNPTKLIISSVLATNIGSASTVLGNPIGVLIAIRGGLSFEDFLLRAFPLSNILLFLTVIILAFVYKTYIKEISSKLKIHTDNKHFISLISIPPDRKTKISIFIFVVTVILIGLHRRLELLFNLKENTMLIALPVISAGIVLLYRYEKATAYIEHEVEWMSLLFFMFLFAQAGVIQFSGIANFFANKIVAIIGNHPKILSFVLIFSSGFLSSILDNTVVVASYIPVVESLSKLHFNLKPLWWAVLFGACYGGNITMMGSTANIIAIGMLHKEKKLKIAFSEWLKIGMFIGVLTMIFAFLAIISVPIYSK